MKLRGTGAYDAKFVRASVASRLALARHVMGLAVRRCHSGRFSSVIFLRRLIWPWDNHLVQVLSNKGPVWQSVLVKFPGFWRIRTGSAERTMIVGVEPDCNPILASSTANRRARRGAARARPRFRVHELHARSPAPPCFLLADCAWRRDDRAGVVF